MILQTTIRSARVTVAGAAAKLWASHRLEESELIIGDLLTSWRKSPGATCNDRMLVMKSKRKSAARLVLTFQFELPLSCS
jgi:hypothetical protein